MGLHKTSKMPAKGIPLFEHACSTWGESASTMHGFNPHRENPTTLLYVVWLNIYVRRSRPLNLLTAADAKTSNPPLCKFAIGRVIQFSISANMPEQLSSPPEIYYAFDDRPARLVRQRRRACLVRATSELLRPRYRVTGTELRITSAATCMRCELMRLKNTVIEKICAGTGCPRPGW